MKTIELRRHTIRMKPGQHLSQEGIDLARRVGSTMGPFNCVITSPVARAYETAIAMGFAVDEQNEIFSMLAVGVEDEVAWDAGFAAFARAVQHDGATARFASLLADAMVDIASSLPEDGAALVISHGGFMEAAAVGCLPDKDFSTCGRYCDYCEGVRLAFDGERFVSCAVLRVKETET
jgi:broad specificity phosphatase PhoE